MQDPGWLIAEDPKSAEVIKPFLAGRDVKRYAPLEADKFLILHEGASRSTIILRLRSTSNSSRRN